MSDVLTFLNTYWLLWIPTGLVMAAVYIGFGAAVALRLEKPLEIPDAGKDREAVLGLVSCFWPLFLVGFVSFKTLKTILFPNVYFGALVKYGLLLALVFGAVMLVQYVAANGVPWR